MIEGYGDITQASCSALECISSYLKDHGYDGLYSDECGCLADDLAPCGNMSMSYCFAGYNDREEAQMQGCAYWITHVKPKDEGGG